MASALEHFVNSIRTLTSQGHYRDLSDFVHKSSESLIKNVAHLDNVLETFDIRQHSLGVLAVLHAKYTVPLASNLQEARFNQAKEFIFNCVGEHIRFAPELFADLCRLITLSLIESNQPLKGIHLLQKAIAKLQLFDSQLTSIHADLCQLSLLAKCFKPALELLDIDVTSIACENMRSTDGSHIDSKYFLLYYYYGGMIYLAVRNLERALYFFEVAIVTPAHAVSHIMIEAYKKYILVSLLLYGKIQLVPKYASQVLNRFIKPLSHPYTELAVAFGTNNSVELSTILNKHNEVFSKDHNLGLVKQLKSVLYKKNIQRLTKTFITLSLSDVASRVGLSGPEEAETHILHMIEDEEIFAVINKKDGMVVFKDTPEKYGGSDVLKGIECELQLCMDLDKQILLMDEDIQVNPQYVKKVIGLQEEEQSKSTFAM